MTHFKIETSWVDYSGKDRPEYLATYANLAIIVDDDFVTNVHHLNTNTTSDWILLSLYPLAEWIATHWWFLTNESKLSGPERLGFSDRHALKSGRTGYCVPDLHFLPEGESFQLEWFPYKYTHAKVKFISSGNKTLLRQQVVDELWDFLTKVDARLIRAKINDTLFQKELAAIRKAESNEEELQFCRMAAWLGKDPFDVTVEDERELKYLSNKLIPELVEDALRAVCNENPKVITTWIANATELDSGISVQGDKTEILKIQNDLQIAANGLPWEVGYSLASRLRDIRPEFFETPIRLEPLFGGELPISQVPDAPNTIDGLILTKEGFECRTSKNHTNSQRFLVARALFDYIQFHQNHSLLTSAKTTRQSQGRAFAAELLAPAEFLKKQISSGWTTPEQVEDLAAELGVSYHVVEHQIKNHRIATVST